MFECLRKPLDLIVIVVTLLTYGCPIQTIVHAFGLDERLVADWRDRAGVPCQQVHQEYSALFHFSESLVKLIDFCVGYICNPV
jgi:hypothetical protein